MTEKNQLEIEIRKLLESFRINAPTNVLIELKSSEKENLNLFHFGLGLYIRNNLLCPYSNLYTLFLKKGILNEDEMSEFILLEWHLTLKNEETLGV